MPFRKRSSASWKRKTTTKSQRRHPRKLMPRLLGSEADYDHALHRVHQLMGKFKASSPQHNEYELLVKLIEIYEDEHYPIDDPDPIEAIKFRMEQEGLEPADLVPMIGSRSKVSEVMNRKRSLSLNMIRALHKRLAIPADVLIRAA